MSRPRPDLWRNHGESQLYLTSHLTSAMGSGPALVACAEIPDSPLLFWRGAKDAIPLYRNADASAANILPGLLEALSQAHSRPVAAEDFVSYAYGALAHPGFAARHHAELDNPGTTPAAHQGRRAVHRTAGHRRPTAVPAHLHRSLPAGWLASPNSAGAARMPQGRSRRWLTAYPDAFDYHSATRTLRVGEGEFATRDRRDLRVPSVRLPGCGAPGSDAA